MSAKGAAGIGKVLNVKDIDQIMLYVGSTGTTTATLKFPGAIVTEPTFTSAASPTNAYAYIQHIDKTTGTAASGATGIAFTAGDQNLLLLLNVENIDYFTANITAWTQGAITVKAKLSYDG